MRKAEVLRAIGLAFMLGANPVLLGCEEGEVEEAVEEIEDEAKDAKEELEDELDDRT